MEEIYSKRQKCHSITHIIHQSFKTNFSSTHFSQIHSARLSHCSIFQHHSNHHPFFTNNFGEMRSIFQHLRICPDSCWWSIIIIMELAKVGISNYTKHLLFLAPSFRKSIYLSLWIAAAREDLKNKQTLHFQLFINFKLNNNNNTFNNFRNCSSKNTRLPT